MESDFVNENINAYKEESLKYLKEVKLYLDLIAEDKLSFEYAQEKILHLHKSLQNDEFGKESQILKVLKKIVTGSNRDHQQTREECLKVKAEILKIIQDGNASLNKFHRDMREARKLRRDDRKKKREAILKNFHQEIEEREKKIREKVELDERLSKKMNDDRSRHNIFLQYEIFRKISSYQSEVPWRIFFLRIIPFGLKFLFYIVGFISAIELEFIESIFSLFSLEVAGKAIAYLVSILLMDYLVMRFFVAPLKKRHLLRILNRYVGLLEEKFYAYYYLYHYISAFPELQALFSRDRKQD